MKNLSYSTTEPPSLLRKVGGFILAVALVGLALMFSVLLFAVVLVAGAAMWGYLWWRTRDLRKQMREQMRAHPPGGVVIEGEAIDVTHTRERK